MPCKRNVCTGVISLIFGLSAIVSQAADISVTDQYLRSGPVTNSNLAGFMKLKNNDKVPVKLVSVDSDIAVKTELHGHAMKDGMMKMFKLKQGIALGPNEQIKLQSGGEHIMLMGIKKPVNIGDKVTITLHFSDGDAIDVAFPVKDINAMSEGSLNQSKMNHDKMKSDSKKMGRSIELSHASIRTTLPGMNSSAAYLTVRNSGRKAVTLSGIKSPVAKKSQLHTTIMKDGVMKMRHVTDLQVKPGEAVEFKPGGYHVMLMGLNKGIESGESIPLTLSFSDGEKVTVQAMAMSEIKGQSMAH